MNWFYWSLLSALFAAATAILAKLGVANINSNLATAVRTSVVFFLAWGIALAEVPVSAIAAGSYLLAAELRRYLILQAGLFP